MEVWTRSVVLCTSNCDDESVGAESWLELRLCGQVRSQLIRGHVQWRILVGAVGNGREVVLCTLRGGLVKPRVTCVWGSGRICGQISGAHHSRVAGGGGQLCSRFNGCDRIIGVNRYGSGFI